MAGAKKFAIQQRTDEGQQRMNKRSLHQIEAIQNEYRRIDRKWLQRQYQILLWLVVVTTAAEILMAVILQKLNVVSACVQVYTLKYVLAPFFCNVLVALTATMAMKSGRLTDRQKMYTISCLLTGMAFIIYTIHSIFGMLFIVFTVPMVLTVIYGDQNLTAITSAACIGGKVLSDLFLFWDPDRSPVFANTDTVTDFLMSTAFLLLFYVLCHSLIAAEQEKNGVGIRLEIERQKYQEESVTDQLTRVGNRQALRQAFAEVESIEPGVRIFLAMLDLDDFKRVNDTFGHSVGDQYLQALGAVMLKLEVEGVQAFRFGGDEFCILFCGHEPKSVHRICAELQKQFTALDVHQRYRPVSISVGVAEYERGERPVSLLDRADASLYQAKLQKGSIHMEI